MSKSAPAPPRQGDVLISEPSPLTGERELCAVVSSDVYNSAGGRTVLVAEIETGTRYFATAFAVDSEYGVVLADRVVWLPVDMLGEKFGQLTPTQREEVVARIVTVLCGA
ncbi:MAG: type II toxin-antitoxin system PemK/MazF family toxin [Actinomycetota bacterium]|nr:type II toxin-antitoxin system PemK/MazF family toxin [Actinomycetota bacterium]